MIRKGARLHPSESSTAGAVSATAHELQWTPGSLGCPSSRGQGLQDVHDAGAASVVVDPSEDASLLDGNPTYSELCPAMPSISGSRSRSTVAGSSAVTPFVSGSARTLVGTQPAQPVPGCPHECRMLDSRPRSAPVDAGSGRQLGCPGLFRTGLAEVVQGFHPPWAQGPGTWSRPVQGRAGLSATAYPAGTDQTGDTPLARHFYLM